MPADKNRQPNRLIKEKSPYLLQHAYNPVDWHPWGEEVFEKAERENKPIFLSIGYSTCHWCHVMERESFEDEEVAQALNRDYIAIKVDREERPDVDHIYMTFCQAMTGHGGWPLTVIMTPDKKPVFAGTYFPKENMRGMPGILEILARVSEAWKTQREKLIEAGEEIKEAIINQALEDSPSKLLPRVVDRAYETLAAHFDEVFGGFGVAPKFPTPHNMSFLLRYNKLKKQDNAVKMVEKTLEAMYKGGIFDHIGFGFSRYSTDNRWLVPHFEKMLYDNALLADVYLETYQVTGKELYKEVAEKIFTYVLRDMTSPEGAFYSAEDADSEGEEGKFYLWTPEEVEEILGAEKAAVFCQVYDIKKRWHFAEKCIPNLIDRDLTSITREQKAVLEEARQKLHEEREKRIHPYKDDKVLTAWNALMISSLAKGARILGNKTYLDAAEKALNFIFTHLQQEDGRLLARFRDKEAAFTAYLDDYAFLVNALLELHATTYKPEYLEKAVVFTEDMLRFFGDEAKGGFFMVSTEGEKLLIRPKTAYDGAIPAGNSVAALNLLRLAHLTGDRSLENKAHSIFEAFGGNITANPVAYTYLLQAHLFSQAAVQEVVIVGRENESNKMVKLVQENFLPFTVSHSLGKENQDIVRLAPHLQSIYEETVNKDEAMAYLCEQQSCRAPLSEETALAEALDLHDIPE